MPHPERIVIGTMRMHEADRTPEAWAEFFSKAYVLGVRSIHSSAEYDSFPLLCDTLKIIKRDHPAVKFRHMVKLAAPNFDDESFDGRKLIDQIEKYRRALDSSVLHDIQWMWRKDLRNEKARLEEFSNTVDKIASTRDKIMRDGLAERFLCFPYTTGFANAAMVQSFCDGFVFYRNDEERNFEQQLDKCAQINLPAIIIRPFLGGKLLNGHAETAQNLFERSINHAAVESAIISTKNIEHLKHLIG